MRAKQKPIELEIRQRKWRCLGHNVRTARQHSKSSFRMEPSGNEIPRQTPNNMAQNNLCRDQTSRQNMEEEKALARNRVWWRIFVRALCSVEEWREIFIFIIIITEIQIFFCPIYFNFVAIFNYLFATRSHNHIHSKHNNSDHFLPIMTTYWY